MHHDGGHLPHRGLETAKTAARKHAGRVFDPALVDLWVAHAADILDCLDVDATWDAVLAAEPRLARRVSGDDLDDVLEAMADLVDLKSPFPEDIRAASPISAPRPPGSQGWPRPSARRSGEPVSSTTSEGSVSSSIWDKPGPLTDVERERAHLHPYLTDKMLMRIPALAPSREIAARHHERLDGSGYPRA